MVANTYVYEASLNSICTATLVTRILTAQEDTKKAGATKEELEAAALPAFDTWVSSAELSQLLFCPFGQVSSAYCLF